MVICQAQIRNRSGKVYWLKTDVLTTEPRRQHKVQYGASTDQFWRGTRETRSHVGWQQRTPSQWRRSRCSAAWDAGSDAAPQAKQADAPEAPETSPAPVVNADEYIYMKFICNEWRTYKQQIAQTNKPKLALVHYECTTYTMYEML